MASASCCAAWVARYALFSGDSIRGCLGHAPRLPDAAAGQHAVCLFVVCPRARPGPDPAPTVPPTASASQRLQSSSRPRGRTNEARAREHRPDLRKMTDTSARTSYTVKCESARSSVPRTGPQIETVAGPRAQGLPTEAQRPAHRSARIEARGRHHQLGNCRSRVRSRYSLHHRRAGFWRRRFPTLGPSQRSLSSSRSITMPSASAARRNVAVSRAPSASPFSSSTASPLLQR